MNLPKDAQERKNRPIARGLLDYFPDACAEVAHVSFVANEQHNPGEEMHWAKEKSTDEADALVRHLLERGTLDSDGLRHSAKVAWRALALLQREIEADAEPPWLENLRERERLGAMGFSPEEAILIAEGARGTPRDLIQRDAAVVEELTQDARDRIRRTVAAWETQADEARAALTAGYEPADLMDPPEDDDIGGVPA